MCLEISPLVYGQKKIPKTVIFGTIRNYQNVLEIADRSDIGSLQNSNSNLSFVPDSLGRFSIELSVDRPTYFRIARSLLYLFPCDKLEVDMNYNDASKSNFKGKHSEENDYLKHTLYPKAGSFLQGGTNVQSTLEKSISKILALANERRKLLYSYKKFSNEFRFLEDGRISADILNSIYSLRTYFPLVHKIKGDSLIAFDKKFLLVRDSFAKKNAPVLLNSKLLQLEVYRDVLPAILKLTDTVSTDFGQIKDWIYAKNLVQEMRINNRLKDASLFHAEVNKIKTTAYRDKVIETYDKLVAFNGENAIDLKLTDTSGNKVQLSSFKGKNIYIDIWATWCGPCIKEQPYLDTLQKKFKDNSNIIFLSLSIDHDFTYWKNYVNRVKLSGFQFVIDLGELNAYSVVEIPRAILIDKDFKIYEISGPMPSNSESIKILEKLLLD